MKRVDENPPDRFPLRPIAEHDNPWWIAKVKPRQEKALAIDFIEKNVEYYLPMFTKVTRRADNNKPRKSVLPLFPGYICFCAERGTQRSIFTTGRVVSVLEVRHQAKLIRELDQIYRGFLAGSELEPLDYGIQPGMSVMVQSGSLKGITGIVSRIHNTDKLVLSVEGLGLAAMIIDLALVKPIQV